MNSSIRGIRNNNPFNIRRNKSNHWLGSTNLRSPFDPVFEQFSLMEYGVRAGLILLRHYVRSGFNTPRLIIERFAPRSENGISAYIDFVCKNGRGNQYIQPDIPFTDLHQFIFFALRIVKYENGLVRNQMINFGFTFEGFENIINKYHFNIVF